ncbi:hypothetical protein N7456_000685 [Penicillium angulare]|uniref:Indoleamine 2,3-dioxygenase n=1 Tax=Penicillium angulare TaxID=116970 RepID=A0A9W9GCL6_9EURO|nr:hypothetical protein N7456_000685 [Penicillium angulare]
MISFPSLEHYDVSPDYGFVSYEPSLTTLNPNYFQWEDTASEFQSLLRNKRLRQTIDRLPVLGTSNLVTEGEWRRAYVLLVFMLHGYVWEGELPREVIPPQLTIPLYEICQRLELPPIATFAGVCLWNFRLLDPSKSLKDLDNLACIQTFTGTADEKWFYLVSVAIEANGAPAIPLLLDTIKAGDTKNAGRILENLTKLSKLLESIISLLQTMHERVSPNVFYHELRPYLAGSKNMAEAGLPNGLVYNDGHTHSVRQLSGGSNAQSSLIQFLDIALGVEHSESPGDSKQSFSLQMRSYMPGPHRRFLEDVESIANLKDFVNGRKDDTSLVQAYNSCLGLMYEMREKHIQIVARFIITPAYKSKHEERAPLAQAEPARVNLANSNGLKESKARGTGGTSVIPLLQQTREETAKTAVS